MSLHAYFMYEVPAETARVAQAAFPRGNLYMRLHTVLGSIYHDLDFAPLYPYRGQPGIPPVRLVLATLMQFAEGLSDRQAAEAVRRCIDWKYLLALELTDAGFDHTVLCEFRTRLVNGAAEQQLLDRLLEHCQELGLVKARGRQRTDSTHVLAAIRLLNRLELVGETMRHALNSLAVAVPAWLRAQAEPEWFARYGTRVDNYRLPKSDSARQALAATIGADGLALLRLVEQATEFPWLGELPALQTLRATWQLQYTIQDENIAWRPVEELAPAAQQIASPYDNEARWSNKGHVKWAGYKVHLTESCDPDLPHLITHVRTTVATTTDESQIESIHAALAHKALLPAEHFVDAGYMDTDSFVAAQQQGIDMIAPLKADPSWQARAAQGYDVAAFRLDWEAQRATCPQGHLSHRWKPHTTEDGKVGVRISFARETCLACPVRLHCTRGKVNPRILTLRSEAQHLLLQEGRLAQTTPAFKAHYAVRAGIEGTIGQALRRCDLRQARYIGLKKTHLQHVLTATALNLVRIGEWLADTPRAKTRCSPFAALNLVAA